LRIRRSHLQPATLERAIAAAIHRLELDPVAAQIGHPERQRLTAIRDLHRSRAAVRLGVEQPRRAELPLDILEIPDGDLSRRTGERLCRERAFECAVANRYVHGLRRAWPQELHKALKIEVSA